jgi:hypothetical protein
MNYAHVSRDELEYLLRSASLFGRKFAAECAPSLLADAAYLAAVSTVPIPRQLVRRRVALLLRGHVRDALDCDAMYRFVDGARRDARMEVDVYVQTWDYREAQQGCSWRALPRKRDAVAASDVRSYLQCDCTVLVLSDDQVELSGPVEGKLPRTNTPKLGWIRMWYGKHRGVRIIEDRCVEYDATVSMRLDFFGAYVRGRHAPDYGFRVTPDYVRDWMCAHAGSGKVRFLVDQPTLGIDNCYMGPTALMRQICTTFLEDLDGVCDRLGRDIHHERMVYWLAAELVVPPVPVAPAAAVAAGQAAGTGPAAGAGQAAACVRTTAGGATQ